jgi:hypothetical protein
VRHLAILRDEIARHGVGELDWISIVLAQLIRLRSEPFLNRFLDLLTGRAASPWNVYSLQKEDEQAARDRELAEVFRELNIQDEALQRDLKTLVYGWLRRVGLYEGTELRYYATFAKRPQAMTRKEVLAGISLWQSRKDLGVIDAWLARHARERGLAVPTAGREFFLSAADVRTSELGRAADAFTVAELGDHVVRATDVLSLLSALFTQGLPSTGPGPFRSPASFVAMARSAVTYAGSNKNAADNRARVEERRALEDSARAVDADADLYLEALHPWERGLRSNAEAALVSALAEVFEHKVATELHRLMSEPGGLVRLHESGLKEGVKYVLFRPSSPFWRHHCASAH